MALPVLLGYLSQFFCEKKALEEELSALKNDNNSGVFVVKENRITTITRNAYFYATGMMLSMLCILIKHTWVYYWSDKVGMMSRILMTGAIYRKVCVSIALYIQYSIYTVC